MAVRLIKPSRVISVALILAVVAWIASGELGQEAGSEPARQDGQDSGAAVIPVQRVSVAPVTPETHTRRVVLSCATEADHSAAALARGHGVIIELNASRGARVRAGDVVATLSDEGREASVREAQALLEQRRAEFEANRQLIESGDQPRNQLPALQAAVAAAEAALAVAEAEADRSIVRAPIDGIVDTVPVQVGQAIQIGTTIAEVVDPDPMLAVGSVGERERRQIGVGQAATMRFIDGSTRDGTVSFVGLSADPATRTYPVEARMDNPDSVIPDGVTCEMAVTTEPIEAVEVPRSALVFSDEGQLGVRVVDQDDRARFVPVDIVDDGETSFWVSGIEDPTRVIVVGQEFVKNGDPVEAVLDADAAPVTDSPA